MLLVIGKVERGLLDGSERDKESNSALNYILHICLHRISRIVKKLHFLGMILVLVQTLMYQHPLPKLFKIWHQKMSLLFDRKCKMSILLSNTYSYIANHILSFESMCEKAAIRL